VGRKNSMIDMRESVTELCLPTWTVEYMG